MFRLYATVFSLLSACAALTACGGGGGGSGSTPNAFPKAVSIVLTKPFTDTGVHVATGEQFTITTSGIFAYTPSKVCNTGDCTATPAGKPPSACSSLSSFTAPDLPCWSLIGKIGANGTPFEVGTSLLLTAPATGELLLGPNDNFYSDNSGSWTSTINK